MAAAVFLTKKRRNSQLWVVIKNQGKNEGTPKVYLCLYSTSMCVLTKLGVMRMTVNWSNLIWSSPHSHTNRERFTLLNLIRLGLEYQRNSHQNSWNSFA